MFFGPKMAIYHINQPGYNEHLVIRNELGCNELGCNELGRNELGRNELGRNELGRNELGYNEHSVTTNMFFGPKMAIYHINQPCFNCRSRSVRYNRVWLYSRTSNPGKFFFLFLSSSDNSSF